MRTNPTPVPLGVMRFNHPVEYYTMQDKTFHSRLSEGGICSTQSKGVFLPSGEQGI